MTWLVCGRYLHILSTCQSDSKNYILLISQNSRLSRAMASSGLVQQTMPGRRLWSARFDLVLSPDAILESCSNCSYD